MGTITTNDGTEIYYKDWGSGRPVVFSHGWPLNADVWDPQLNFIAAHGFRVIAHDRRGHGRSSQPWNGHDMDTYADDLSQLIDKLNLSNATLVGHSTGGGEVTRYLGRHGTSRVTQAVLLSAVPPLMLKTPGNPEGQPIETFDEIREGVRSDASQFYQDLSGPFYGVNRAGSDVSEGTRDAFWLMSMQAGLRPALECVRAFSETDFTDDLTRIDVPVLIAHGDDDQIVPLAAAAPKTAQLVKDPTLKIYEGCPHGLHGSRHDTFNNDLLEFLKS
jgi:non-heme chloroperoxidase